MRPILYVVVILGVIALGFAGPRVFRAYLKGSGGQDAAERERRQTRLSGSLAAVGVFLVLLSAYMLTQGGEFFISDGEVMYQTTVALVDHHTVELAPNPGLPQIVPGRDGRYFSKYGIGQPLLAALPYMAGKVIHKYALTGIDRAALQHYLVTLMNLFITAFTGVLLFLTSRRLGTGIRLAAGLALAWGLGTMAWPYSKTFFSEPLFGFLLILAAFGLLAYHQTRGWGRFGWLAVSGLALGYSLLTRVSGAPLLLPFVAYAVWASAAHTEGAPFLALWNRIRPGAFTDPPSMGQWIASTTAAIVSLGVPLAACLAVLMWHNVARFGSPLNNGYTDESFSTPILVGLRGLLFSPGKSIFLYVPLAILGLAAWPWFLKRSPAMALLSAGVTLLTLGQYAMWWAWWGGWCWGPRFLVPTLPFIILSMGPLLERYRAARVAAWALGLAGIGMALLGALVDFNPYLADLTKRAAEPDIYFQAGLSPVLAHLRSLLEGQNLSVATYQMQHLGFYGRKIQALPYLLYVMLLAGAALLALARSVREQIEIGTYAGPPHADQQPDSLQLES